MVMGLIKVCVQMYKTCTSQLLFVCDFDSWHFGESSFYNQLAKYIDLQFFATIFEGNAHNIYFGCQDVMSKK